MKCFQLSPMKRREWGAFTSRERSIDFSSPWSDLDSARWTELSSPSSAYCRWARYVPYGLVSVGGASQDRHPPALARSGQRGRTWPERGSSFSQRARGSQCAHRFRTACSLSRSVRSSAAAPNLQPPSGNCCGAGSGLHPSPVGSARGILRVCADWWRNYGTEFLPSSLRRSWTIMDLEQPALPTPLRFDLRSARVELLSAPTSNEPAQSPIDTEDEPPLGPPDEL